ncbi:MAG: sigma-54 interaction domain-containing protein, partial [Ignavibacteriales bacterium]
MIRLNELDKRDIEIVQMLFSGIDGVIVIDELGLLRICTDHFQRLLGGSIEDFLGRPIEEVFPHTRITEVLNTGRPIIAEPWEINGRSQFISCYPIKSGVQVIGALGFNMFRSKNEADAFVRRVQKAFSEMNHTDADKGLSGAKYSLGAIIGESEGIVEARERVMMISPSNVPVLIQGETGTGKELIAHAIHLESMRRDGPFVRVNCAGIPDSLVESELFGYDEGAFTGARRGGKPGKFELANRGSIFLDEISELSKAAQAKLLRAVQENEIERVGSTKLMPINARIISATNQPLTQLVEEGHFRKDLMFRLAVFTIFIPPLRTRTEDIPLLCRRFIEQYNRDCGANITGITDEGLEFLISYHWPGNVRELFNALERACLDAREGNLTVSNILRFLGVAKNQYIKNYSFPGFNLKMARHEAEKSIINRALQASEGNRQQAA